MSIKSNEKTKSKSDEIVLRLLGENDQYTTFSVAKTKIAEFIIEQIKKAS